MSLRDENISFLTWEQILTGRTTFARVANYKGIIFKIYPKEMGHNEPHCHVSYQGFNISISLISYQVLSGNLPLKQQKDAIKWVENNIEILKKYWNEYHEEIVA